MSKAPYISFVVGAAIGSLATWYFLKEKYAQIAQEEIDSVKEVFSKKFVEEEPYTGETEQKSERTVKPLNEKPDIIKYAEKLNEESYVGYDQYSRVKEAVKAESVRPYVIPPEEFGERDGYAKLTFYYYADGVLADDGDQPIDDADILIGINPEDHFGEYEQDSVFVRNDERKIDFEILRSLKTYSEVIEENPYKAEV